MSNVFLKELDVTNCRSIRGHVHAPLDAKVVLIHGENGAGKTSLLSAMEFALTADVQALHRADPSYAKHLLHRSAAEGSIIVKTLANSNEERYNAVLDEVGARSLRRLSDRDASFFSERAYLPQSLLSQLLQIYQDSGSDAESPLAKFVGDLLGLDRLDALEAGLKLLGDVRNIRKVVEGWSQVEIERDRLNRFLDDQRKILVSTNVTLQTSVLELKVLCDALGIKGEMQEASVERIMTDLRRSDDEIAYTRVLDQQRRLASLQREIALAERESEQPVSEAETNAATARDAYARWESLNGDQLSRLRSRINELLPSVKLSSDLFNLGEETMELLRREHKQFMERAEQARQDLKRSVAAREELDVARRQMSAIDGEVGQISTNAGVLASALGELTSYIDSDVCPICDRDFSELRRGSLSEHAQHKIVHLSASAARLLTLGKARGESQLMVGRLEIEVETLGGRSVAPELLAEFDRHSASLASAIAELERITPSLREGAILRASDVAFRRVATELQSRSNALVAARETVSEFAVLLGTEGVGQEEGFEAAIKRIEALLKNEAERLSSRLALRRRGSELVITIKSIIERKLDAERKIASDAARSGLVDQALERAQSLRTQGQKVRDTVDGVRSAIIRSVFNNQLNRIWRDLFVRLASSEPFVPAFRIPESETRQLQPKLITVHRDSGEFAGTPGAMLSAGNLNTAALTLFLALHLSVSKELPWLILDDPVQSMDDVHIAHFAALLRTLSKEQGRQIVLAVHDRQLFEYLRLELSPAFPDDSLITLELLRGTRHDTLCISNRLEFREETTFLAIA